MANVSVAVATLMGIRSAGSKDSQGIAHGGIYYPAHTKNGKSVSARWEGNFIANGKAWTDAAGNQQEGRRNVIRLVVWNSKNSAPGKGMADVFAKYVSVGKEISCQADIETFMKRVFENGQPLVSPTTGQPIEINATVYRVSGNLIFGEDSAKHVAAEIAGWQGQLIPFGVRPAMWNVTGHADNEAWKQIIQLRASSMWDGQSGTYGYARVIVPEGAQLVNPAMPAQPVTNAQQGLGQPATIGYATAPVQQTTAPQVQQGMAPTQAAATMTGNCPI
jgi:hypothetical protein